MKAKMIATLAAAALLAVAPVGVKGALTVSASFNDTASSEEEPAVSAEDEYMEYLTTVEADILAASKEAVPIAAASGSDETEIPVVEMIADDNYDFALSNGIMQQLVKCGNVDFAVTFTYKGVAYTITIPAGRAVDNDIPWYGPLYLIQYYGTAADQIAVSSN
ncbi:MAG: hypothetical protein LUC90_08695 [Lachnospiraceae bacterium]|nr:hypothetical protein [Lachnospiraceae bacterium]